MNTIRLKFTSDIGKAFNVSLNYANPALKLTENKPTVQAAVDTLLLQQPFVVQLASSDGAQFIEKTVTELL